MNKILTLIVIAVAALGIHSPVMAQVGMGGVGGESFVMTLLSQRNDCRARYPSMAEALDASLNKMIDRNLQSFTRDAWRKISAVEVGGLPKLTKGQCEQLSVALPMMDLKPIIVDTREIMCNDAMRTLAFERRSVIGVRVDDADDAPRLTRIEAEGPASIGGLRVGDTVEEVGETTTPTACQLVLAISSSKAGEDTKVVFSRDGVRMQTQVRPRELVPN